MTPTPISLPSKPGTAVSSLGGAVVVAAAAEEDALVGAAEGDAAVAGPLVQGLGAHGVFGHAVAAIDEVARSL